jgi:hypothetical protein
MPLLSFHAPALRAIAESLRLPPLLEVMRQPGVQTAYRVTVIYHDGRFSNSVATVRRTMLEGVPLEIAFQRALDGKPLRYLIPPPRYEMFVKALAMQGFDKLADQENLPDYNVTDFWLIERAAGSFVRSVIVAPELATGKHATIVAAVRTYLPEALKEVE